MNVLLSPLPLTNHSSIYFLMNKYVLASHRQPFCSSHGSNRELAGNNASHSGYHPNLENNRPDSVKPLWHCVHYLQSCKFPIPSCDIAKRSPNSLHRRACDIPPLEHCSTLSTTSLNVNRHRTISCWFPFSFAVFRLCRNDSISRFDIKWSTGFDQSWRKYVKTNRMTQY